MSNGVRRYRWVSILILKIDKKDCHLLSFPPQGVHHLVLYVKNLALSKSNSTFCLFLTLYPCYFFRESRIGSDKVLDQVEENLIMELENIRLWQFRFKMAIEQVIYTREFFLISIKHKKSLTLKVEDVLNGHIEFCKDKEYLILVLRY